MEQRTLLSEFATDTLKGFSADKKYLLSKYFYDDQGSAIFQDIMNMPEYYLTNAELEIFTTQKNKIIQSLSEGLETFNLVELGSGDGLKTKILLQEMTSQEISFYYMPVDISEKANNELVESLNIEIPGLSVYPQTGDYFQKLKKLNGLGAMQKVILFLGSNIGNFSEKEMGRFFYFLSEITRKGDKILIGFDLKKSPQVIMEAYSDPHGHTRRFNLNLLERLNRELDADFNVQQFEQHTEYNPESGVVKSFLVSAISQKVTIGALGQSFHFKKCEPIFTELSRKFDQETIEKLATSHGFKVQSTFTDSRQYFVDSLWARE